MNLIVLEDGTIGAADGSARLVWDAQTNRVVMQPGSFRPDPADNEPVVTLAPDAQGRYVDENGAPINRTERPKLPHEKRRVWVAA